MIHVLNLISTLYKFLCVYLTFFLTFFLFFSLSFLPYLFPYLLTSEFLTDLSTPSRIDPFHFQAGGCRRQPNLALVFCVNFMLWYILLRMHVCFRFVCFRFSVLSQEIGWEEHLRNDLFCVGWDIDP